MRWVVIGVAALLVGLLTYGVAAQGTDTTIASALAAGRQPPAPEASLQKLGAKGDGTLRDYRGKVVLVNFWASWCPPCTAELPLVQRTQAAIAAKGATVLGINTRDASEKALAFVRRFHLTFPSLRDGSGDYAEGWGITGYPESFLLDRRGHIVAATPGPLTQRWIDDNVIPLVNRSR